MSRRLSAATLLVLLLLGGACAGNTPHPRGRPQRGSPPQVRPPQVRPPQVRPPQVRPPQVRPPVGTVVEGIASWYGPGYHGRLTSSGERFDQDALTAAHYDWAFGTRVRVTLLSTGRSAVVRINDRFPNHKGRLIDLSRGAARAIGLIGPGTGRVRLEVLGVSAAPE